MTTESQPQPDRGVNPWLALIILGAAMLLAYGNSFSGPLVLDDLVNIADNASLRDLRDWRAVFWPDSTVPTAGRPLLNLTFALNHAAGGVAVRGYHVVNVALHLGAAMVAFLLMRRTFALPVLRERLGTGGSWVALFVALVWTVHPLGTGAVTYLSQRAEVLMALCYLATLYCLVRGGTDESARGWLALSVVCCALGMMAKEVMVTAPVLVFLYDRTFVAGTFAAAWRRRRGFYLGIAATWLLLGALMLASHVRDRGVADAGSFTTWTYALTECEVVPRYLKLSGWPHPLVFDYEIDRPALAKLSVAGALLPAAFIAAMVAAIVVGLRRGRTVAFFGAWFFVILAPTSSAVPITFQPMAESRAYLPLLGAVALVVVALHTAMGRRLLYALVPLAVALTVLARDRNADYGSSLRLWADTVAKCPTNARAHNAYGMALSTRPDRLADEIAQYETALRLRPDYPDAENNLANALVRVPGRWPEAERHYREVLRRQPESARTRSNLGNLLSLMPGRLNDAFGQHREAVRLAPQSALVHLNYGLALSRTPATADEAIAEYERALAIEPSSAEAHNALGLVLATRPGREAEAIGHFQEALRLRPDSDVLHLNLATILSANPARSVEAAAHYAEAARLKREREEAK